MKTLKPQALAGGSSLTCQGYTGAEYPGRSLYQRCSVHAVDTGVKTDPWLKHPRTHGLEAGPLLFIPLVITHEAYMSVGHLSLKPSKDIVHRCTLNGFI